MCTCLCSCETGVHHIYINSIKCAVYEENIMLTNTHQHTHIHTHTHTHTHIERERERERDTYKMSGIF